MTITYKVLGQSNPTANTNTTLYTVPAGNSAVVSTITVCNLSGTTANFRIAVRPASESISNKHYLNYDTQLPGSDQISLTLGLTLSATDVITVFANTATVTFNVFGSEIY